MSKLTHISYTALVWYLGDGVEGVGALRRVEAGVEDTAWELTAHQHRLHGLPHSLFGAERQVKAALRAALTERDVVLDVHRDGHQAEGRKHRGSMRISYLAH